MNGEEVSKNKTKKITAHVACEENDADVNDEYDADDNDAYDETATFLAGCLSDSHSDEHSAYDTLQASAIMIDDALFFGDSDPVPSTNEVPRLSLDENLEGQIHVDREHGLNGTDLPVPSTNEVPRPSLEENLGDTR